jgi:two-component system, chemotaxis family, chemotaxis protein CheY
MQETQESVRARRRPRGGAPARGSAGAESETAVRQRILVVEDDRDLSEALGLALEHAGYEVAFAPNGKAALDLLRDGVAPAVILLDLAMPVMSGWAFRRHQVVDPALAAIPVIVLSADPRAASLADSPGIRDVLTKPLDVEVLLRALERAFAG